ncbi:DUF1570 domain-containing protein [Novipirellula aureliae]|uniref:DUF1570 domain-containing protein n=1 Tax=Novipirellula aureliae TaxID=2527966 RepID=UPI0036F1E875
MATIFFISLIGEAIPATAVENIVFTEPAVGDAQSIERSVVAEVLVEAQDGGVMLLSDDGRIWMVQPEQIIRRSSNNEALSPIDDNTMAERMLKELPSGFSVYRTANYLVIHNTDENHVRQVATLFEQLYRVFFAYWNNQGWKLNEPRFPLVALVLANHDAFIDHAGAEIGDTANSLIGYYHLSSNRMTTFNVPDWERNIATIIHEATHQLAYNCGLQRRFADNPMWVSEGLAMFFEAPDRRNSRGWRGIGNVNQVNLKRWKQYVPKRPEESLATLLADDDRFRSPATASDAYAEGWALTYFLIKTMRDEYVDYMRTLSEGKPLVEQNERERIATFEKAFGMTLVEMDKKFTLYMRRVR